MKELIKKIIPLKGITLARCMKSYRSNGRKDMIIKGFNKFFSESWVYPKGTNDEDAYIYQLSLICREIEINDNQYFFYPFSSKIHRFIRPNVMNILSITPAYEYVVNTDFTEENNEVIKALKILLERVQNKQSKNSRFLEIKRLCSNLLKPSESFEQALQKILFFHGLLWQMGHGHNGLGRFDMVLYPFYKKEIENGTLDKDKTEEILRKTISIVGANTHEKSATLYGDTGQYILLGGIDKNGDNVENDLTFMFLDIFSTLSVPDPKLILRVNNSTSKEVYDSAAKCLLKGNGSPLILNEDKVIPLMKDFGYEEEDCYNIGTSACWEPLILGKSFDQNNNLLSISPLRAVNTTLFKHKDCKSFTQFMNYFYEELEQNISLCAHDLNMDCSPLFSLLFEEPRKRGLDISKGGAKYSYHGMLVVGLPNVVNSLLNINELVFEKKVLTLDECVSAIENNFKEKNDLRTILKNQELKFGRSDCKVIEITNNISDRINDIVSKIKINGQPAKVGFSSPNYISQAHDIPASMDGRLYGEPLATHISPVGKDIDIAEILNFSGLMKFNGCRINGNVVDFIIPRAFNRYPEKLSLLLQDAQKRGVYEMQLNVLDKKTLIDARNHPEKYPNLVVRVWGFSAYFNELPDEYKVNLINRAESYAC